MRHQKERVYRILNYPAETYTEHTDASKVVSWLCGKRTSHLGIQIVGTKGRVTELQVGDMEPVEFLKMMTTTMYNLCQ